MSGNGCGGRRPGGGPAVEGDGHGGGARGCHLHEADGVDGVLGGILPTGVADVGLIHEVAPFAAGEGGVVGGHEVGVGFEEGLGLVGHVIGGGATLLGVEGIFGGGDVHFVDLGAGEGGEEDELVEGIARFGRQFFADRLGLGGKGLVVGDDSVGFVVVGEAVGGGIDEFGFSAAVVLGVFFDDVGDLIGVGGAELARGPLAGVVVDIAAGEARGVVGEA